MKCPKCVWLRNKSSVYDSYNPSCCLVIHHPYTYHDEDDVYHDHTSPCDQSYTTYSCSNGHNWTMQARSTCHCGWESDPENITWLNDDDYNTTNNGTSRRSTMFKWTTITARGVDVSLKPLD